MLAQLKFNFSNDASYLTHKFHTYPAKFPPQLPRTILSNYSKPGEIVLDPFVGSGTTLVEALYGGINSIGIDINPLACLISKVKTTLIEPHKLFLIDTLKNNISQDLFYWQMGKKIDNIVPEIPNIKHWFQPNVIKELSLIKKNILDLPDPDIRDLAYVAFSSIIVRVSNQESDTRFAAINKNIKDGDTINFFFDKLAESKKLMITLWNNIVDKKVKTKIINIDVRDLTQFINNSVDIIITSPPYANTYDYYLYHKFRMYWLDMDVTSVQYAEIGSRREYSSLKKGKEKWEQDLIKSFKEMKKILKIGKFAFIVIGDSVIRKEIIKADQLIEGLSDKVGFKVIDIVSSKLSEHSKTFNPSFTQKEKREHLIVLQNE
ncbi:MAG TPA: DNA methyltransferase [Candidatus Hydrogenedens sp.]|nr:DNA methyltransferase [Candidatus Hydrogenedens sp.]